MIFKGRNKLLISFSILSLAWCTEAAAETTIKLINSKYLNSLAPVTEIAKIIKTNIDVNQSREIRFQIMYEDKQNADHILVYLFSKKSHKVEFARINIDLNFKLRSIQKNYRLLPTDNAQQPGISAQDAKCPDPSIEFIAFAPNDIELEQDITKDVADAAEGHSLKTVRLLKEQATRENYLNYMSCPKLEGNFYDGDADPDDITTVDGVITYSDIESGLREKFRYKVTNIWLACEAYNDPIKSSVMTIAQSQKYAAGINDLIIGPSDKAAACAMKEAMNHKPMTAAFDACYKELDDPEDHWGFGGDGTDIFGT